MAVRLPFLSGPRKARMTQKMKTVLLTGFEPFDGEKANPSAEIARRLDGSVIAGRRVVGAVLPCVFGGSVAELKKLLGAVRPELVMCVGQAGGRAELLERELTQGGHLFAQHANDAAVGAHEAGEHLQDDALAGSAWPDEAVKTAFRHAEADVLERRLQADARAAERLGEPGDLDHALARASACSRMRLKRT